MNIPTRVANAARTLFVPLMCLFAVSCAQHYTCMVSSYGRPVDISTYFIEPDSPELTDDLAFEEFAYTLRQRLNESGYTRTDPSKAALCIVLSYNVGEEEYIGTTTNTTHESHTQDDRKSISTTNASTDSTKKVEGNGVKITTNSRANTMTQNLGGVKTVTDVTTKTYTRYDRPVSVMVTAYSTQTNKKVWEVIISDHIPRVNGVVNTSFRRLMPWMLTAAQPFYGRSWEGRVELKEKDGKSKGLTWPYGR